MVKSERPVLFKMETWQVVSSYLFIFGMWFVESFSIEMRMQSEKKKKYFAGSEQVPWTKDRRLHLIDLSDCLFNPLAPEFFF